MRGDILVIQEWHRKAGRAASELILPQVLESTGKFTITVAGESGSGKSEIAEVIAKVLAERDIQSYILQQDDYFVLPPKSNETKRHEDIDRVGISEVQLGLMDRNLEDFKDGQPSIIKPLVIFEEDRVIEETVAVNSYRVAIADGTYTTTLKHADCRIFIARTYIHTREARRLRDRESQDAFLESVLRKEHEIISSHKPMADIVITRDYDAEWNTERGGPNDYEHSHDKHPRIL